MAKPYYGLTGKLSRQGTQLKGNLQKFSEIGDHSILRNRDAENQHPIEAIEGLSEALEGKANASDIPTKTSDLDNDSGFLTQHQDISGKLDVDGDGSEVTVDFTESETRTNLVSGGTLATAFSKIAKWLSDLGTMAFKNSVTKSDLSQSIRTSLDKADTALQEFTETDPTVPQWAKSQTKPVYTAEEVGALPDSTVIPTKLSQLQNDAGYLTEYTEIDPTVPQWARQATKPTYTAQEVGALPIGGGTLTGPVTLSGAPTENLHPATKKYVDDIVGNVETLLASI